MLQRIELQQIKAYWLQYHAISHTQLHLLFLIKLKKKYFNNMEITLDHLFYCLCKELNFPPSWLIPVLENLNSFPTYFSPSLLRLPVFGYHKHISVKHLLTKEATFSSHCGFLSLLILPEV